MREDSIQLGAGGVTKDSLAGGTEDTAKLIYTTALTGISEPIPLGIQLAMGRVLKHLRTGWYIVDLLCSRGAIQTMSLQSVSRAHKFLSYTGEAAACLSVPDRRHGHGQRTANATFRQVVLDAIAKHGDEARKGVKHFESDAERRKVILPSA